MQVIAEEPQVQRFGHGIADPSVPVSAYLAPGRGSAARNRPRALHLLAR